MNEQNAEFESLNKQINFYKQRIEELAGDNLKFDITVSGLKHELRQRRKSFALLSELQQKITAQAELSSLFEVTIQAINPTLGMDKTVVLIPTEQEHVYRPSQWLGFPQQEMQHFSSSYLRFPEEFAQGSGLLLVNRSSRSTPLIEDIRSVFVLPYFICLPVMFENAPVGLLLSGRLKEAKPFYPPLEQGDVDTFQAIADLITATIRSRRLTVLKEMDRLKTEFFANISHEFRTPITLTLGPLEQILKGRYGEISNELRKQLEVIEHNQGRLLGLINQILDLTKFESGAMQVKAGLMQDMNHFIESRLVQFRSMAEQRGIELRLSLDPRVDKAVLYIDRENFDKLLFNLLANALKFTRQGYVEVSTKMLERAFQLAITDTGIGIKQDQLPHIFDRFRQADGSESREYAGTGLGLALVKEIVKLHGGNITVHSEYGKGSTFRVIIPVGKSHLHPASIVEAIEDDMQTITSMQGVIIAHEGEADLEGVDQANEQAEASFDSAKLMILYVEDNADLRNHLRTLLQENYNVFLAVDGNDGFIKAKKYKPDLIITDQMMPHKSGRSLLREIRKDRELSLIPVIFLTARAGTEARIESLDAGADDYITKPFDEGELLIRIRNILRAHAQEKELAELNRKLEVKVEEQMAELELAARIQKDLLPKQAPELSGYEIAGRNIPAKQVGGDYFDFICLDEHRLGICLGDVCGKGLPAALIMANLQATIRSQAYFSLSAKQCLERSNKLLARCLDKKTFASLFFAILDTQNNILRYANAGQNWPVIFSSGIKPAQLATSGLVLGVMENMLYEEEEIHINSGDLLLIYSDGIYEAMNEELEEFGEERLREIIVLYRARSANELIEKIISSVKIFTGGVPQNDDMTLIILKRK